MKNDMLDFFYTFINTFDILLIIVILIQIVLIIAFIFLCANVSTITKSIINIDNHIKYLHNQKRINQSIENYKNQEKQTSNTIDINI